MSGAVIGIVAILHLLKPTHKVLREEAVKFEEGGRIIVLTHTIHELHTEAGGSLIIVTEIRVFALHAV